MDVQLSVDLVRLAWSGQISGAVLVSGDSDFVPAVHAAKHAGVIVRLAYGLGEGCWVHNELKQAVDERLVLDRDFFDRYLRRNGP